MCNKVPDSVSLVCFVFVCVYTSKAMPAAGPTMRSNSKTTQERRSPCQVGSEPQPHHTPHNLVSSTIQHTQRPVASQPSFDPATLFFFFTPAPC